MNVYASEYAEVVSLLNARCGEVKIFGALDTWPRSHSLPVSRSLFDVILLLHSGASNGGVHMSGIFDTVAKGYRHKFYRGSTCQRLLDATASVLGDFLKPAAQVRRRMELRDAIAIWKNFVYSELDADTRRAERSVLRSQDRRRRCMPCHAELYRMREGCPWDAAVKTFRFRLRPPSGESKSGMDST